MAARMRELSVAELVRRIAVHEAGHAVVHLVQGVSVRDVRVWRSWSGGWQGAVRTSDDDHQVDACAVTSLAGVEAETRWWQTQYGLSGRDARATAMSGAMDDLVLLRRLLAHRASTVSEARARRLAGELVAVHWSAIERVGTVLAARRRLSGSTVASLAKLRTTRFTADATRRRGGGHR